MDGSSACVLFTFFPCAAHAHSGLAHPLGATQNLEYNVPGGKLNRGMSVVDSVEILKGRKLTDDEYFKAALLGWGVEFVSVSWSTSSLRPVVAFVHRLPVLLISTVLSFPSPVRAFLCLPPQR